MASFALALAATNAATAGSIVGSAEIVDGDGLAIGPVAIRIHGIDAAETGQRCAKAGGGTWKCDEATMERLGELVADRELTCEPLDRDSYGRIVARCLADGADVGGTLVSEDLAWAFTRYSDDYVQEEAAA